MNLVFIYGPSAAGKLTVANLVSKACGYPVFHNHMSFDIGEAIFGDDLKNVFGFSDAIRKAVFEEAASRGVEGIIFTFVYCHDTDQDFVSSTKKIVEKSGGQVYFVQLQVDEQELMSRVENESRHGTGKMQSPQKLKQLLCKHDLSTSVQDSNHLEINNTKISAKQAAQQIVEYYHISK